MKFKYIFPLSLATFTNYYCFSLFIFLLPQISQHFFVTDSFNNVKDGLLIISFGFLSRPLGGLLIGLYSDIRSKKGAYIFVILLAMLTTIILPTLPRNTNLIYLIIIRLLQTFCLGSEFTNSILLINEKSQQSNRATSMAIITTAGTLGWIFGSISSLLVIKNLLKWTTLYNLSTLLFCFSIFLISKLNFRPSHYNFNLLNKNLCFLRLSCFIKMITYQISKNYKSLFLTFFLAGINGTLFYLITVFSKIYMNEICYFDQLTIEYFITFILILYGILLPISGRIADKYNHQKLYKTLLVLGIILILPITNIMLSTSNLISLFMMGFIVTLLMSLFMSVSLKLIAIIFPNEFKYTGVGFSYNLGNAIFGGFTPYISIVIYKHYNSILLPFIFYQILLIIVLIALNNSKSIHRNV